VSPSETRLVKLKVRAPKLANTRALWKVRCYLAAVGLSVRRSAPLDCAFEGMKLSGQGTALAAHCILQDQAYFEIKIINKGMSGPPFPTLFGRLPAQGMHDSLAAERDAVQAPLRSVWRARRHMLHIH
jgi:hypothetical protein